MEVGAVREVGRDGSLEGEVVEGETVDAAIVTRGALDVRGGVVAGFGEVLLSPVLELLGWVLL